MYLVIIVSNWHLLFENLQVNRATSFMDHLLSIMSEQRHFAYNMFEQLNEFRHAILLLGSGGTYFVICTFLFLF